MPSVFSIFGKIEADTAQFQNSLRAADALLAKTAGNIDRHAQGAINLGKTTAVTARSYEKLNEKLDEARERLQSTAKAFERGEATAKQMASAFSAVDKASSNINSKLLDSSARLVDWKQKADSASGASKSFNLESLNIASSIGNVITGLSNAAASIANFVSFVYDGSKALFNFVKSASDFGSEIKDFQDKTGLGAEAITTIKFAAEQTGKSLESLAAPIGKFSKLLGEAADGSEKASGVLQRFGIDPKTAVDDLQGSLDKAVKKILEFPEGAQRAYAATQLFGRGGLEVVGVLKGMDGGLTATIQRAKELGITLSEADVKAADDFGDTLGLLGTQVKVLGSRFALQFGPDITRAMTDISNSLAANQKAIAAWGARVQQGVSGAIAWFGRLADAVRGYYALQDQLAKDHPLLFARTPGGTPGFTGVGTQQGLDAAEALVKAGKERNRKLQALAASAGTLGPSLEGTFGDKAKALFNTSDMEDYFDALGKGSDKATASTKKLKDSVDALNKAWTSSTLAQFVKAQGFIPGAGFQTTGHNEGSLHGVGRALDVGLNTNKRTTDQIVDLMVKSIQAGIRVVDERVRPPGQKVFGGPNIHLEENDRKASFFNPALDYGGKLDLLKALDADRIAGKGKSITATLRSLAEDGVKKLDDAARKMADSVKSGFDAIGDQTDKLFPHVNTPLEDYNALLANPDVRNALGTLDEKTAHYTDTLLRFGAILKTLEGVKDLGSFGPQLPANVTGTGSQPYDADGNPILPTQTDNTTVAPPPQKTWSNFWDMMQQRLLEWKGSLPSIKTVIGENLIGTLQNVGDVFAGAVQRWDGTVRGFFQSIAQGFGDMAKQIIAELVRILIYKAVFAIIGAFSGGGGNVGIPGTAGSTFNGITLGGGNSFFGGHFASGGFPQLNKLAVVGERGPELFVPTVPGRVFNNSDTKQMLNQQAAPTINVTQNFHANANGQFSKQSAEQAARTSIEALNRYSRRTN